MAKKKTSKNHRHKPLSVKVTRDGVLTIEIGVETNAYGALRSPYAYEQMGPKQERPDTRFTITNAHGFAVDTKRALLDEREDGSSLLTDVLDAACKRAVEDGSEFWLDTAEDTGGSKR